MNPPYFLHVHGDRPHKVNVWKVYATLPAARGQLTRWLYKPDGSRVGDWQGSIYRLDPVLMFLYLVIAE